MKNKSSQSQEYFRAVESLLEQAYRNSAWLFMSRFNCCAFCCLQEFLISLSNCPRVLEERKINKEVLKKSYLQTISLSGNKNHRFLGNSYFHDWLTLRFLVRNILGLHSFFLYIYKQVWSQFQFALFKGELKHWIIYFIHQGMFTK